MYRSKNKTSASLPREAERRFELEIVDHERALAVWHKAVDMPHSLEGSRTISSANRFGRSNSVIFTVSSWCTPKCLARHVTVSPGPNKPRVTPFTARSESSRRTPLVKRDISGQIKN